MNDDISILVVREEILEVLRRNKINTLQQLCRKTRNQLRKLKLTEDEIFQLEDELAYQGFYLKETY